MRKKLITIAILALAALTSGYVVYRRAQGVATPVYRTAVVQRGNVDATVSATGTLGAVTTVQVGTQVSGQIAAVYVDFNSKVKKGQLIARVDPTLQQQAVADAQTGVARADATLQQTKLEFDRTKLLHDQQVVTDPEFNTAQLNYQVAKANSTSAQIALDKARQNLSYTSIYAPIDGVVVERDIDVGQTVASSLQAPQLFVIANDLSQMQILATVDESDIGLIKEHQPVSFTVQAYPGRTFTGTVRQVRINSTTVNNVVNYTAVVTVGNPDGTLLPGMTATVRFLVGSADSVLTVPNAALRFTPPAATAAGATTHGRGLTAAAAADSTATVWQLGPQGALAPVRVRTGLTDGTRTQMGETEVHALRGVDLTVAAGEMVAVMGSSGSGKSTLMNILGCLDVPTAGSYRLDGIRVDGMTRNERADLRNRKLGFVFQGFNLLARTSAVENVELPLLYDRTGRWKETRSLAVEALTRVGLAARLEHQPSELSGGQQQRVAIARALVTQPTLLLADEPTGNLDSRTSVEVMALFQEFNEQGITVIIVTHEPDIAQYAHRVVDVRDGRILRDHAIVTPRLAANDVLAMAADPDTLIATAMKEVA